MFFEPELFAHRARVREALDQGGVIWLSHYSAVDLAHEEYGIEVCGIQDPNEIPRITAILVKLFPSWKYTTCYLQDYGREVGWKVIIHQRPTIYHEAWRG